MKRTLAIFLCLSAILISVAAITGVSRVLNNRHWLTDVVAGAAIGRGPALTCVETSASAL